jgi:hypothetical protein
VHANEVLEADAFKPKDWQVIGEYVYDDEGGRHQAFYSPVRDVTVLGVSIKAHERIQVEQSLKYSEDGMTKLWTAAGVVETERWMVDGDEYGELIPNFLPLSNPGKMGARSPFTPSPRMSNVSPRSGNMSDHLEVPILSSLTHSLHWRAGPTPDGLRMACCRAKLLVERARLQITLNLVT